jgi:hypothetical protein
MRKYLPVIMVLLAGCATAAPEPALLKPTQSGAPEAVFKNTTAAAVQASLANRCLSHGKTLEDISAMQVTCVQQFAHGYDAIGAMLIIGGDGSLPYYSKFTYATVQTGTDVRVVAHSFITVGERPVAHMPHEVQNALQKSFTDLGGE